MRVIGTMVLIEQLMTKKKSAIIMTNGKKEESFDTRFKILQMGGKCPVEGDEDYEGIKVGDAPVFSSHVTFHGAKPVTEIKSADKTTVLEVIVHTMVDYADIIAIE